MDSFKVSEILLISFLLLLTGYGSLLFFEVIPQTLLTTLPIVVGPFIVPYLLVVHIRPFLGKFLD